MREADRRAIVEIGVPSIVLMENAGRQVVSAVDALVDDLDGRRVAVVCGRGSNGGDGFVVARTLHQRDVSVSVFVVGAIADVQGDARINLDILGRLGVPVVEVGDAQAWELHGGEVTSADLVVDAMFGTGLRAPLTGLHQTVVEDLNASPCTVVAIDLPSGLSADVPDLIGPAVEAAVTVTIGAPKVSLVLPPAEQHAGEVVIADIGIPAEVIEDLDGPELHLLTRERMRALVTPRAVDAHKGDCGRVTVVAGSRGRSGAAVLAGQGALRSGAGLLTLATPASTQPLVAIAAPDWMTVPLPDTADGLCDGAAVEDVLALQADVLVIGPGLGRGAGVSAMVRAVVERAAQPLVLDADALNVFAGDAAALQGREGRPVIITPHPGEMARLVGCSVGDVQANRLGIARDMAATHQLYVVLKGYRTLVVAPDGRAWINPTGSPGMATGGTGDVLAGMLGAWLAQLLDAEAACQLAVYLHGAAGELADADEGEVSMTASDLAAHLGDALLELTARRRVASGEAS